MSGKYKELFFSFILSFGLGRATPVLDYRSVLALPMNLQNEETLLLANKEKFSTGHKCLAHIQFKVNYKHLKNN